MRKLVISALVALALLVPFAAPSSAAAPVAGKVIALDPGHGGSESGAVYQFPDGSTLYEKDINLAVALALRDLLVADGATVVLTRTDDSYLSLDQRVAIANGAGAQALVSIHHNGSSNPSYDWTETYYSQRNDQPLAVAAYNALLTLGLPGHGAKHSPGFTLTVRPKMPSTLTEAYFVTNPTEASKFYGFAPSQYGQVQRVRDEARALWSGLNTYLAGLTGGKPGR